MGAALRRNFVPRRLGKTIGTFSIGACLLLILAHALFGDRVRGALAPYRLPVMRAEISPAEHAVSLGAPVRTADGTLVGNVSGLSRDAHGHIERIRVTETTKRRSEQRTLIIRDRYFDVVGEAVQLKFRAAELDTVPEAMTEDAAGS